MGGEELEARGRQLLKEFCSLGKVVMGKGSGLKQCLFKDA
jgi:hypothetical protein